jgi:hypothetical protein
MGKTPLSRINNYTLQRCALTTRLAAAFCSVPLPSSLAIRSAVRSP